MKIINFKGILSMSKVKHCKYCRNHPESCKQVIFPGYTNFWEETTYTCPFCNNPIVDTIMESEEMDILSNVSHDTSFLEAMIDLKQKDPIEFQLKMSQFKATQNQAKVVEEDNVPKCPTCNSTNIQKIGGLERVGSVAMLGLFSKKINKSFKCGNCGHTW